MAGTKVKICGVTTGTALEASIASGASFVGLNFYPPSPRFATEAVARRLSGAAGGRVPLVGVFVDPDDAALLGALAQADLAAIQLHRTTAARRAEVKARFGVPVWAVIEVAQPEDTAAARHLDAADLLLWDAKTPRGALPGGMGHAFDWTWLAGVRPPLPWGLAGGLDPSNVARAIAVTGTPLVDVASGVETAPGIKDAARIAAFCAAARQG